MKTKIMRDYKREKLIKFILRGSIALDIFIYMCFFIGFAIGLGGAEIGFLSREIGRASCRERV